MPQLKRALALIVLILASILLATESTPATAAPTSGGHARSVDTIHCC
jgi:hypothetical protein